MITHTEKLLLHNRMWRQGMTPIEVYVFKACEPTELELETALKNKKQRFENMVQITKSQIQLYRLRLQQGNFADISIDEHDKAGRISIASAWGNWSHYWGACGESFKQFLIGLDIHYAANKFGAAGYYDMGKTVKVWKDDIQDAYQKGKINIGQKSLILQEIEICDMSGGRDEFIESTTQQKYLMKFYDNMPPVEETIHPQFAAFWEKAWLPFVAHLKEELQAPELVGTEGLKELAKRM